MKIHRLLASVLLVVIGIGTLTLVAPAAKAVAADEKVEKTETKEEKSSPDKSADEKGDAKSGEKKDDKDKKDDDKKDEEDKVVTTEHMATIHGKEIKYTATAGKLAMKSDDGKTKAHIFFIAYTKNGVEDLGQAADYVCVQWRAGVDRACGCTWGCSGRSG